MAITMALNVYSHLLELFLNNSKIPFKNVNKNGKDYIKFKYTAENEILSKTMKFKRCKNFIILIKKNAFFSPNYYTLNFISKLKKYKPEIKVSNDRIFPDYTNDLCVTKYLDTSKYFSANLPDNLIKALTDQIYNDECIINIIVSNINDSKYGMFIYVNGLPGFGKSAITEILSHILILNTKIDSLNTNKIFNQIENFSDPKTNFIRIVLKNELKNHYNCLIIFDEFDKYSQFGLNKKIIIDSMYASKCDSILSLSSDKATEAILNENERLDKELAKAFILNDITLINKLTSEMIYLVKLVIQSNVFFSCFLHFIDSHKKNQNIIVMSGNEDTFAYLLNKNQLHTIFRPIRCIKTNYGRYCKQEILSFVTKMCLFKKYNIDWSKFIEELEDNDFTSPAKLEQFINSISSELFTKKNLKRNEIEDEIKSVIQWHKKNQLKIYPAKEFATILISEEVESKNENVTNLESTKIDKTVDITKVESKKIEDEDITKVESKKVVFEDENLEQIKNVTNVEHKKVEPKKVVLEDKIKDATFVEPKKVEDETITKQFNEFFCTMFSIKMN